MVAVVAGVVVVSGAVVAGVVVVSGAVVVAQRRKTFKENVNVSGKKLEICGRHNEFKMRKKKFK